MSHLNYFEPYISKNPNHEDQLTRAFLVLLRYSNSSLFLFYDMMYQQLVKLFLPKKKFLELPSISEINLRDIQIETQVSVINDKIGQFVVSVLLSDEMITEVSEVTMSKRGFRYDAVITISEDVTLIIENKPRVRNVWKEQLNPNLSAISKEVKLIEVPSVVEWKKIISKLSSLSQFQNVNGLEKLIIEDFLEFINRNFSYLTPYDKFSLCKSNSFLLNKRLEGVLQTIIIEKSNVGYQAKWKSYYIKTGLDEITMVIFSIIEDDEKNDYVIRAAFYFGDTTNQSRSFYKKNIPFSAFEKFINSGWHLAPHFHISSINTHLVWFHTNIDKQHYYYEYWINHIEEIKQYSKKDYLKYHKKIEKLGLIDDTNKLKELDDKIINTKRTTVNICPALMIYWDIPSSVVIEKDDAGKIEEYFKGILNLGLSVINERPKTIIE